MEESKSKQSARSFRYSLDDQECIVRVISGDSISFGRHSGQDVCLRIHPTSNEENARLTSRISGSHFRLNYDTGSIIIEDLNSTNGTSVEDQRLQSESRRKLLHQERIQVADALELSVQMYPSAEEHGKVECCLISRVNNLPMKSYLWLIDHAEIGSEQRAAINVPAKQQAFHGGLDFGNDSSSSCVAHLKQASDTLTVASLSKNVSINGVDLSNGESKPLFVDDKLKLGDTEFLFL